MKPSEDPETYDEDSPQFTRERMERGLRFHELPPNVQKTLKTLQNSRDEPVKETISIHLSKDVADKLRASGGDWESQVNEALRSWLEQKESLRKAS